MNHVVGSPVKAYDFLLKFLLVGDSDVGKGEILASLEDGATESPYGYHMGKCQHGAAKYLSTVSYRCQVPGRLRPLSLPPPCRLCREGIAAVYM